MNKLNNTKLNGTILSTHYVENTTRCIKLCAMHDGCVSTNVGPNNGSNFVCQLLGGDKYTNPTLLVNATGWSLFTTATRCDNNPCNGRCLPQNETFKCAASLNPSVAYDRPLLNFTFDKDFGCSGCHVTAHWGDGKRINVPDRMKKVLYFPEKSEGEQRLLFPGGCFRDLTPAFPRNCDSDGFIFSFWYRTFMRSLGSVFVLDHLVNGFLITLKERNAKTGTASWIFVLRTTQHEYRFLNYQGPDASQWVHLLLKFDVANDLFSVYINGNHSIDGIKRKREGGGLYHANHIKLASVGVYGKRYYAMFDDMVYYNRLLTNEEILNLHKEQSTH
ncbi:uncharacterized protein LOC130614289 isoform X2 [Hydractinia symbiolongicarpus]|nr:uncharacterized protein LOC130614289 isoform X2 [Hydractinia symbiolongicarpus]XP_057291699.1 uncharacterized protein LOC130614289 isoform X2 [Hydractinia symbiolongicarpus]